MNPPIPNTKKRNIVKVYDPEVIPEYPKKLIRTEWQGLLTQEIPSDLSMAYYFVCKLYEETCRILQDGVELESHEKIEQIQDVIDRLKAKR